MKPASATTALDPRRPGLGAERQADVLRERRGRAQQRREPVVGAPDRVQVVLEPVAGGGLDDHPHAVAARAWSARGAPRRPGRPCRAGSRTWSRGRSRRRCSRRPGATSKTGRRRRPRVRGGGRPRSSPRGSRSPANSERGNACGHQDRRGAVAAADVGDAGAALQPLDDAVERRQPRADQVRVVAGPEEPLAALVDVVVVLVPADAEAAAGGLGDLRGVEHGPERDLEEPGQVGRAVCVGQRDGVLGREAEAAVRRSRRSRPRPGRSATRARSARGCRSRSASSAGVSGPPSASAR